MRRFEGFGKKSLILVCALALGVSLVAIASNANAFDEPIPSKIGLMKPQKLFKLVSKPTAASLSDCVAGNPIDLGGLVTATMGAGTLTCNLSAGNWKLLGKCEPGKLKGYKYLNKAASDPGNPCKVILVKSNVIKIIAKGSGALPSPLASGNPPTNISLEVGNDSYCAEWTDYATEKADKLVKAKDQDAPSSCAATPCECTGATRLGFETGIATGQPPAGTLSNYRCSNASSSACVNAGDCDFGTCLTFPSTFFCALNNAIPCTTDPECVGTCAEVSSGNLPLALKVGSLYTGGGLNSVPLPLPVPDQGLAYTSVSTGDGQTLTLGETTPGDAGKYHCTKGRTCSVGGAPCVVDGDCGAGTCVDNCIYGPQLPIPNAGTAATSVCVVNAVGVDASGSAQCDGGDSDLQIGLRSVIYLNGDLFKSSTPPDLPGVQPCPLCVPICSGGSNNGLPCRPANSNRACVGGTKVGKPCTADGQCPSSTCAPARNELLACTSGGGSCPSTSNCLGGQNPGATCTPETSTSDLLGDAQDSYPTSHTCLLDPLQNITANIGGLPVALNMTTGTQEWNADDRPNGARVFCGFCRDVTSGGTLRFQGDPSVGGDGNAVPCNDDSGCSSPFESCVQRNPGAFSEAGATRISVTGDSSGCLGDLNPHPGTLVSIFCVPPTFDATVDAAGDLPGPGSTLLYGEAQLQ